MKIKLNAAITILVVLIPVFLNGCRDDSLNNKADNGNNSPVLLNVSYDPTREMYQEINKSFSEYWLKKTGQTITINQSHGGSGKQARSVIDGLGADVVTLALAYDIDAISERAGLIQKNWQSRLPNSSSPYTSIIVFLVRKGNPKNIKDWDDLARPEVSIVTPNPKTSGGARWNYLSLWAFASAKYNGDEAKIKQLISRVIKNVPVFDSGARGSTNTFVQRQIGDVLLAWENEALLIKNDIGKNEFEIVYPSVSILAEPPVSIVDKVVDKKGTRKAAEEYLNFLYSDQAQEIMAKHYFRPYNESVLEKHNSLFPKVKLVTIQNDFNGWKNAQKIHFNDGGTFDQVYAKE